MTERAKVVKRAMPVRSPDAVRGRCGGWRCAMIAATPDRVSLSASTEAVEP
jgi:hypothetical protein